MNDQTGNDWFEIPIIIVTKDMQSLYQENFCLLFGKPDLTDLQSETG